MFAGDTDHLVLEVACPQRPLALQRRDRMNGTRPLDGLGARLGQAEIAHLAGLDQLGHRADGVLDRDIGVDPVLVIEVDVVDTQPTQ